MIRVAFDIGGTFTDFVLHDGGKGTTLALKVPTTLRDPGEAVIAGLEKLLTTAGIAGSDVGMVLHATTVATNAVLERKGAATGLITTDGFRDILIIGRQKRYETYDLYIDKPQPLVQRRHIAEVVERVGADGTVVTPLDMPSLDRAIDAMVASGRETVAVSLLHAYARPEHELQVRDRIAKRAPHLSVSISSEVSPKFREYERTSTTVTNAFVKPIVDGYLRCLEAALKDRGFRNELFVMQSSGGLISPELARDFPVRIIESGPAAGILMCAIVGKAEGREHVITFDMGGTTAKLGAVDGGTPAIMPTFEIDLVRYKKGSGLPINVPAVEMIEIGAGGGSIARADKGMIVVGPDSAGADPGPICYGRGGTEPTITDANVVLGYISPDWFNAGAMQLDARAAEEGLKARIGDPLGISVPEAAWGIHLIATSNMENALRIVSVERGRDPRRYAMVAFGGAGPLHAARLARSVGIPTVIVPYGAGVGSAIGLLEADPRIDVTTTRVLHLDASSSSDAIADIYRALEKRALHDVKRAAANGEVQWLRYAQMRYAGQGFEIHVDLPGGPIGPDYGRGAIEAFNEAYLRKHKFLDAEGTIEAVDWTLVATIPSRTGSSRLGRTAAETTSVRRGTRKAWFPEAGGYVGTAIIDRQAFASGATIAGPAIVEDPDSTTVILPGDVARISAEGHLIIDIAREASR
ncbi:MAG: hydantoinase/oxoprolinase family protein [Hyphomicrobiaceae bacterium]